MTLLRVLLTTEHHLPKQHDSIIRRVLYENGLTLALIALFLVSFIGHALTGFRVYNHNQMEHGGSLVTLSEYLRGGAFMESVFENWESEFLQMGMYVILTATFRQKGSAESKPIDESDPVDDNPSKKRNDPRAPWPVRRGGWVLTVYEHSLSLVLLVLFIMSFLLHAVGGAREYSAEQLRQGGSAVGTFAYMTTSQFWFESFQNWQSEFLSIAVLVILSIYLRERGSAQSKPVATPHAETA